MWNRRLLGSHLAAIDLTARTQPGFFPKYSYISVPPVYLEPFVLSMETRSVSCELQSADRVDNSPVRRRLDGGWGWVVCCGTFIVNFVVFGIHNSFGVVYAKLLDDLKLGEVETGRRGDCNINFICFRWLRTVRKWRNDILFLSKYSRLVYSVLLLQLLKRLRFVIRLNIRLSCFNNSGERWMCRGYFSRILIAIFHHFKSTAREKSSRCFQFYSTLWLWHLANRSTCIYMKLVYICVYIWSSTIYFRSGQN